MNEQKDTRPKQVSFCLLKYRLTISPVGVIIKKKKTMIPLELCFIAFSVVIMFILVYCYRKATLASKHWRQVSEHNLGKPEELTIAGKRLHESSDENKNIFVIQKFIPTNFDDAKVGLDMLYGVGILAHPRGRKIMLYCHMAFHPDFGLEVQDDGKTFYELIDKPGYIPYLRIVTNN